MYLRPMNMADADKMLEWKNYEETRKFAILTHDEIKKEDHYRWLEKNIQYFKIIQQGQDIMGAVRLQDSEISIWVDREFRGGGIATQAINMVMLGVTTEWGMERVTAKIVDGNIPSMRAFIHAGFLPVAHQDNFYILHK